VVTDAAVLTTTVMATDDALICDSKQVPCGAGGMSQLSGGNSTEIYADLFHVGCCGGIGRETIFTRDYHVTVLTAVVPWPTQPSILLGSVKMGTVFCVRGLAIMRHTRLRLTLKLLDRKRRLRFIAVVDKRMAGR